ncbi:hypothetical protein QEI_1810, partial [Clostridioides difficile CD129]
MVCSLTAEDFSDGFMLGRCIVSFGSGTLETAPPVTGRSFTVGGFSVSALGVLEVTGRFSDFAEAVTGLSWGRVAPAVADPSDLFADCLSSCAFCIVIRLSAILCLCWLSLSARPACRSCCSLITPR